MQQQLLKNINMPITKYLSLLMISFGFRYLAQNFDWLQEQLDEQEDDYILFDCPGKLTAQLHNS